ncbi:MAG: HlyD family efflux transporter periplasmic adaptor subunit [Firmicutes bacterium]|nr:HlyD family efflux transporter periplasmic adaptor subunit [Bacillota bacterium]
MPSGRRRSASRFIPVVLLTVAGAMLWSIYSGFHIPSTISDVQLATAERRVIEDTFPAKGVFIRDEEVYISPVAGVAELLAGNGAMVRARTPVARVAGPYSRYWQEDEPGLRPGGVRAEGGGTGSAGDAGEPSQGAGASRDASQDVVVLGARSPGIVRYSIDGLESILCRESPPNLTLEELTSLKKPPERVKNGDRVAAGAAVFKIVDPAHLDVLVYGPAGDIGRLSVGKRVWVRFPGDPGEGLDPVPGRIVRVSVPPRRPGKSRDAGGMGPGDAQGGKAPGGGGRDLTGSAVIELDEWIHGADGQRFVDVCIISDIVEGVSVPVEAIVKRGGKALVYVSRRSGISMREVSVRARNPRYAIVKGVEDGQAVIINPLVLERQGM